MPYDTSYDDSECMFADPGGNSSLRAARGLRRFEELPTETMMKDVNSLEELLAEPEVVDAIDLVYCMSVNRSSSIFLKLGSETYIFASSNGPYDFAAMAIVGEELGRVGAVLADVARYAQEHGAEGPGEECQSWGQRAWLKARNEKSTTTGEQ